MEGALLRRAVAGGRALPQEAQRFRAQRKPGGLGGFGGRLADGLAEAVVARPELVKALHMREQLPVCRGGHH